MANPASPESMFTIESPGPPPPNLRPTPFYNKPTPPTPISPNPQPAATTIISNLYSGPRKQPIFTTPGAVQGPVRADSLAPVAEASGQSTVTDEEILINRSGRPDKVRQLTGDQSAVDTVVNRMTQANQPWYLRPQYADNELKVEIDGSIKLGTLRALIEQLTGEFTSKSTIKGIDHGTDLSQILYLTSPSGTSSSSPSGRLPQPRKYSQ
jgi:son of sevenless-like protein